MNEIIKLIFCHLIGDYVLQIDFIANSKGSNFYDMFVHCALYCSPFAYMYGIDFKLIVIFVSHIAIDLLKARYKKITYAQDQALHYLVCILYLI